MALLDECPCPRIVRLDCQDKTYWICNQCNAQYVPLKAVQYKQDHLVRTLEVSMQYKVIADRFATCLRDVIAICPGDFSDMWKLLEDWEKVKGIHEQAARVRE